MPAPDFSYVTQPLYTEGKEPLEYRLKELYSADDVRTGAVGLHSYTEDGTTQKNERYWLKTTLINSDAIVNFEDFEAMNSLGREVAESVLSGISNADQYDRIQVTFVEVYGDQSGKQMKQNIFYSLPDLEVIEF